MSPQKVTEKKNLVNRPFLKVSQVIMFQKKISFLKLHKGTKIYPL